MRSIVLSLFVIPTLALAEPVVVRFPDESYRAVLSEFDSRLPSLTVGSMGQPAPHPGTFTIGLLADLVDENGEPLCAWLVEGYSESQQRWLPVVYCLGFVSSQFPYPFNYPICQECDWSGHSDYELGSRFDHYLLEIRVRDTASSAAWRSGWIAYQGVELRNLTCDPVCGGSGTLRPELALIALALETEPDALMTPGGGLCPADLNFDALVDLSDLSDISAFVEAFSDQTPAGDRNSDGIYDLSDVVAFVIDFDSPCTLGDPP